MAKDPKKLTIQQLTTVVEQQERALRSLSMTVKATDAAAALALYSLIQDSKVRLPEHWKTTEDIKASMIPEAIQKMLAIMSNMKDTEDGRAVKTNA